MPTLATWYPTPHRTPGRSYADTVRVLDIRKHTARIEALRGDGTRVRRFVKLDRLMIHPRGDVALTRAGVQRLRGGR